MIDAIESRLELICPNFFAGVFVEKDPFTHSDMWDALLLMTKSKVHRFYYAIVNKNIRFPSIMGYY